MLRPVRPRIAAPRFTDQSRRDKLPMEVSVSPPPGDTAAVVLSGEGVPTKIGIGAFDLPMETWLYITNDHHDSGPYTKVERVAMGMLSLADRPIQGTDRVQSVGGATFRDGSAPATLTEAGTVDDAHEDQCALDSAVWKVTRADGRCSLLVIPKLVGTDVYNSFGVADYVAPNIYGEFCIEAVNAGTYTAGEPLVEPGWTLLMDRTDGLDCTPSAGPRR